MGDGKARLEIKTAPPVLYNHNKDEQIGSWANLRQVGNQLIGRIVWADLTHWPKGNTFATWCAAAICARCRSDSGRWNVQPLTKDASKEYGPWRFTKSEILEC